MNRLYWRKIGLEWAKIQTCYQGSRDRYFRSRHYSCKNSSNPCSVGIETLSFLYSDCLLLIIHYQINSHRFFSTVSLPPTGGKPLMKVSSKLKEVLKEHISKMELRLHEEQKKVNHPWHCCISLWLWGETVRLVALWPCCLVTLWLLYCLVPSNAAVVFALLPCCLVTVWLLLYCLPTGLTAQETVQGTGEPHVRGRKKEEKKVEKSKR